MKTAVIDMDDSFKIKFDDSSCFKEVMIYLQERGYTFLSPDSRGVLHEACVEILDKPVQAEPVQAEPAPVPALQPLKRVVRQDITFKKDAMGKIVGAIVIADDAGTV
jgi:hypothetical protein